jgi:hypothetical protein
VPGQFIFSLNTQSGKFNYIYIIWFLHILPTLVHRFAYKIPCRIFVPWLLAEFAHKWY